MHNSECEARTPEANKWRKIRLLDLLYWKSIPRRLYYAVIAVRLRPLNHMSRQYFQDTSSQIFKHVLLSNDNRMCLKIWIWMNKTQISIQQTSVEILVRRSSITATKRVVAHRHAYRTIPKIWMLYVKAEVLLRQPDIVRFIREKIPRSEVSFY